MSKRLFDVLAATAALAVLGPLMLLVGLWVRCDSRGPALYRQIRVGRGGKLFTIYKFRTMAAASGEHPQLTVGADPRITRAGQFLRRTKIDELPQLLNVLIGDMSIVGPRPEVPRYVACYPEAVRPIVLSVAPGITDWAAIRYKDENALLAHARDPERVYIDTILPVKLDYYVRYVRHHTLGMDLRIIAHTLLALAR